MRCKACDCALSSRESVRKGKYTKEYLDLCDNCLSTIESEIDVIDNNFEEDLDENFETEFSQT